MPRVKESSIEALKQRVSMLDVASTLVQLKRAGSLYKGLSPFNNEKTPSFFVNPVQNRFKCFSSGHSGDVYTFVMMTENLTFHEAVETLARRFGIELEYEQGDVSRESLSLRSQLFQIHETVFALFRREFMANSPEAQGIRHYWTEQRGFTIADAEDFDVGYAPANPDKLLEELRKEDYSPDVWRESGIFFSRANETNLRNFGLRFAGRLMIAIRDIQGRVVGFSGRVTEFTPSGPSQDAKYVNSPETPIFQKSQLLYGMHRARRHLKEEEPLLIVEGQLDAMRCWASGLPNVVAPQGTAITDHQMALVRRYTKRVELLLDGDRAGREAALRTLPLAWKAGLEPRFLVLPQGEDPDSLLRNGGPEALIPIRKKAEGAVPFLFHALLPNGFRSDRSEKQKFLQEFFNYLSHLESNILKQDALNELTGFLGVSPDILSKDFQNYSNKTKITGTLPANSVTDPGNNAHNGKSIERDILCFLLHYPEYGLMLSQHIETDWVEMDSTAGQLLNRILAEFEHGEWNGVENIDSLLESDNEKSLVSEILCTPLEVEFPEEMVTHYIRRLCERYCDNQIKEIDQEMANPENSQNTERLYGLLRQREQLKKQRQEVRKQLQVTPAPTSNNIPDSYA